MKSTARVEGVPPDAEESKYNMKRSGMVEASEGGKRERVEENKMIS